MMTSPLALALGIGALYGLMRLQNFRWRLLASAYASNAARPARAVKRLATVIAIGGGPFFTKHVGVRIEVCDGGLSLSIVPLFSAGAARLFLPFAEMNVHKTDWYLNTRSFALRMERGSGVELIIDEDLFTWVQAHADDFGLAV